jgi:hypothetical protein
MLIDDMLGKNNESALAAVAVFEASMTETAVDDIAFILGQTTMDEVIKGMCFASSVLSMIITSSSDAKIMYASLRATLEEDGISENESVIMELLEATQEDSPGLFYLKLYGLDDKVAVMGQLLVLCKSFLDHSVFGSKERALAWLRSSILEDYLDNISSRN